MDIHFLAVSPIVLQQQITILLPGREVFDWGICPVTRPLSRRPDRDSDGSAFLGSSELDRVGGTKVKGQLLFSFAHMREAIQIN